MRREDETEAVPDNMSPGTQTGQLHSGHQSSLDSGIASMSAQSSGPRVEAGSHKQYNLHDGRGKLVILLNLTFAPKLGLSNRPATAADKDISALRVVFETMFGFEVQVMRDLRAADMLKAIEDAIKGNHMERCNCFALVLLTHGTYGGRVYGIDTDITLEQLMQPIKDCTKLAGKPKLLFVQACRGKNLDRGMAVPAAAAPEGEGDEDEVTVMTVPVEADCVYAFSTADGYVSFNNPANGSWFVQTLCSELTAKWSDFEFMEIMREVNYKLAYERESHTPSHPETHRLKQVSSVTTTLTKKLCFNK